jgi:hypothetical protein
MDELYSDGAFYSYENSDATGMILMDENDNFYGARAIWYDHGGGCSPGWNAAHNPPRHS